MINLFCLQWQISNPPISGGMDLVHDVVAGVISFGEDKQFGWQVVAAAQS